MHRVIVLMILPMLYLTFSGCHRTDNRVIAEIGKREITIQAFKEAIAKLPSSQRATKGDVEQARSNLQLLIDKELMILEAIDRGLDTSSTVKNTLDREQKKAMMYALYQSETRKTPRFREEEMRDYFAREKIGEQIRIRRIVVQTKEEAQAIFEELKKGADFAEVAREKSVDKRSAPQGGDVGWWTKASLPFPILSRVVPLEIGQIDEPFEWRSQFLIHTVTDRQSGSFEEWKKEVERAMQAEEIQKNWDNYLAAVKKRYRMTLVDSTFAALLQWARSSEYPSQVLSELETLPLVRFKGGERSVRDYFQLSHTSAFLPQSPSWADSAKMRSYIEQVVAQNELMPREARRKKLDRKPSLLSELERTKERLMVEELRRTEVMENVEATEEEARQFYEEHLSLYYLPAKVIGVEVLVETREEAERILKRAQEGADLEELAEQYTIRAKDNLGRKGIFRFFPFQKEFYGGDLVEKAFKANIGELNGPVEAKGGYSIFKVLDKEEERYEPFEAAKRRAINAVRFQKAEALFQDFIRNLNRKYANQIVIHNRNLGVAAELLEPEPASSSEADTTVATHSAHQNRAPRTKRYSVPANTVINARLPVFVRLSKYWVSVRKPVLVVSL